MWVAQIKPKPLTDVGVEVKLIFGRELSDQHAHHKFANRGDTKPFARSPMQAPIHPKM